MMPDHIASAHNNLPSKSHKNVSLSAVEMDGELFFRISDSDLMRPFFMSLVSDTNHWMFISSNGGISAGRKNAQIALFPYYTDDKITESAENTGSKTIIQIHTEDGIKIWEPFSIRCENDYHLTKNLYKSKTGNKILFEEINHDLGLSFRYEYSFSTNFGFVKKSNLINTGPKSQQITVLDGLQNILPYGVGSDLQNKSSNLVDAYKRSELSPHSGLGIFALSAIISDKAEPSEALKANTVFSLGLDNVTYLLSSSQLAAARTGADIVQEEDIKAEKGAYFIVTALSLGANESRQWMFVANVNQSQSAIIKCIDDIVQDQSLQQKINDDINTGSVNLEGLVGAADGLQKTADLLEDSRHYSNVLFNIMRGGIFDHHYQIDLEDFIHYLSQISKTAYTQHVQSLRNFPGQMALSDFKKIINETGNIDLMRLANEYLPLKFSRRHGDPSRPWNTFSINTHDESSGAKILDYEGNWRDLFQNWEALVHSYPFFIEGMITKFLNASTFDGYNPYRVTKVGFDWETIELDNPWSYIGYWGDHQIIYLLKFLEFAQSHFPDLLSTMCKKAHFVYANVPYQIKPYPEISKNPKDTIVFDSEKDHKIRKLIEVEGLDGALLRDNDHHIVYVHFIEKILATALAKISNFVVDGGIWLNTQRPEWNDANNALVGNGTSMVTLYYLRRFMNFLDQFIGTIDSNQAEISDELFAFFHETQACLIRNEESLKSAIAPNERKVILDELGTAGSNYRMKIYSSHFSGQKKVLELSELKQFVKICLKYIDHSMDTNLRSDGLYHGYNLLTLAGNEAKVSYLPEMLEGQVAVLSAGKLKPETCLTILESMRHSALYRPDQQSYILYPNRELPGFLKKNKVNDALIEKYKLNESISTLTKYNILEQDIHGIYHFNGNFKNAREVNDTLQGLEVLSEEVKEAILLLYEEVFHHKAFTGRSGTFYGYEGLGSIYWHMVSKLRLAVYEVCQQEYLNAGKSDIFNKLIAHYYAIVAGLGIHKSPNLYGAFPTDPYSHTPMTKGAQQPGMTGQVKEDIICRWGELGVIVQNGIVRFQPFMLKSTEFLNSGDSFKYYNVEGKTVEVELSKNSLAFTYCQVPIIYEIKEETGITIHHTNGETSYHPHDTLDRSETLALFSRANLIEKITVGILFDQLIHQM